MTLLATLSMRFMRRAVAPSMALSQAWSMGDAGGDLVGAGGEAARSATGAEEPFPELQAS